MTTSADGTAGHQMQSDTTQPHASQSSVPKLPPLPSDRPHADVEEGRAGSSPEAEARPASASGRGSPDSNAKYTPAQQGSSNPVKKLTRQDNIPRGTVIKEKVQQVDAFATKMVESTLTGGIITIVIWLATIAYIVLLTVQWVQSPATKVVGTEWTIGFAPQPMRLTCLARSGCLISNVMSGANSLGIGDLIPQSERNCTLVPFNTTIVLSVAFSVDPTEGISVMWDPTTANSTSLRGGALYIYSDIRCPGDNDPACVFQLPTPVAGGTALLQYVETKNETAEGQAQHRREWFANMISSDASVLPASTPCFDPARPDPRYATWVQARLRMNSFYNTVDVSKDSLWLFLFGAVGGAYALFLQLGALLVALIGLSVAMNERWRNRRNQSVVHDESALVSSGRFFGSHDHDDYKTPSKPLRVRMPMEDSAVRKGGIGVHY